MRAVLLSVALLLSVVLAAPGATALTDGCDGVVVSDDFTGHCGDACNGSLYLKGGRVAEHICHPALCQFLCGFP